MDAFIKKGFYTIGALKTNRVLYPCGIKRRISEFALHLRKQGSDVSLVTVGSRSCYVYRYEGSLNGIDKAVVLISYPKDANKLLATSVTKKLDHNNSQDRYDGWNTAQVKLILNLKTDADILERVKQQKYGRSTSVQGSIKKLIRQEIAKYNGTTV